MTFSTKLLHWFDQHGRKNLPWQHHKTPYRVWVSEIMLQQTQVSTVIPYYLRFMERFPTVESLALAEQDEVLHYWTGLGYYSRARHLHRAAQMIHHSDFPKTMDELLQLPGIGRSTAGAILAIAFNQKSTILDGNVKRVLTRFHGIKQWPGNEKIAAKLWSIAEKYTPAKRSADYTQAIMDLGATICIRGQPRCDRCPLQKKCVAKKLGLEKKIPAVKPRTVMPQRQTTFLILKNKQSVLLEKRPAKGIWGGLWSFPQVDEHLSLNHIKDRVRSRFHFSIQKIQLYDIFRHTFTHFHLDILPAVIAIPSQKTIDESLYIWYNLQNPPVLGLPAPVKDFLGVFNENHSLRKIAKRR